MKLGFEESRQAAYHSGPQKARVLTEAWASAQLFCPSCGAERLSKFQNNRPVADLYCANRNEEFELKSQKSKFGPRVLDGAYRTMCERLAAQNNPNLMLLNYSPASGVNNLLVVPKHFFVTEIIEERKPLRECARRTPRAKGRAQPQQQHGASGFHWPALRSCASTGAVSGRTPRHSR